MSTTRFINTVIREIDKAHKQAERDRIRREKDYARQQKQLERERLKQEKEEEREKVLLSKEQIRKYKDSVKKEWNDGKEGCDNRLKERNQLRLKYIR